MSLVTLGSVAYNPYNTALAEMAVTGMKLGMENLDRMEENDRFSLSETSKAFAAVTDNLFKGQEMQLRSREADRMDRSQAFQEHQFGEKMAFDKDRAKIGDSQWLKTFEQGQVEFEDTKIRTGLLAEEGRQRKAEFEQKKKEYAEGAPLRSLAQMESLRTIIEGPGLKAAAKQEEQAKTYISALEESLKATKENIKINEAAMLVIKGYEKDTFEASGGNALTAASSIAPKAPAPPTGPPTGGGRTARQEEVRTGGEREAMINQMTNGAGGQSRNPREYSDPAYTQRVKSQLAYDYEVERRIMQLTSIVASDPKALREDKVFKLKGELESLFASGMRDKFLDEKGEKRGDWLKTPKDAE